MWETEYIRALRVLGASSNDSFEAITTKYKRLVVLYHPDNHPGEEEQWLDKIRNVNDSYGIIKRNLSKQKTHMHSSSIDISEIINSIFNGQEDKKYHVGKEFYYWDPDDETYMMFSNHVSLVWRNIKHSLDGNTHAMYNGAKFIDLIAKNLELRIEYYLKRERIKPFYCLCKIVRQQNNVLAIQNKDDIKARIAENGFDSVTFDVELVGSYQEIIRTYNIEHYAEEGRGVLFSLNDDTRYPEKIEVFTEDDHSLGNIPAHLAMCIAPLVLSGKMDISGIIKEIKTRKDRGPKARGARAIISLTLKMLQTIEEDELISYQVEISDLLKSYSRLCHVAKQIEASADNREFFNTHFVPFVRECKWVEKMECVFHIKGIYGQNQEGTMSVHRYENEIEDFEEDRFYYELCCMIADQQTMKGKYGKYYCAHNGRHIVVEIKPCSGLSSLVDVRVRIYEDTLALNDFNSRT